jgi:prepilin-type N-terminal cleavage/methylation domain-containing protein
MNTVKTSSNRRRAFTLIELIVVIGIILVIAALAAAFAPRVSDSQNLSRAVDQFEQWLLTAKMRAKRDGLATGIRLVPNQGDPAGIYSQVQYIQQPDPLSGGFLTTTPTSLVYSAGPPAVYVNGGILQSAASGVVTFAGVDFTLGLGAGALPSQLLVQPGDFLEVRDGGVYMIGAVTGPTTLTLGGTSYDTALKIGSATTPPSGPTTNYRILRQPRVLIGEAPLQLPGNLAVDTTLIPQTVIPGNTTVTWSNVAAGTSGYPEILFSPSGAVVGTNAGNGKVLVTVYDMTMSPFDINRVGIVAVQCRTGFIGAYGVAPGAGLAGYDPFGYAESGRESGL